MQQISTLQPMEEDLMAQQIVACDVLGHSWSPPQAVSDPFELLHLHLTAAASPWPRCPCRGQPLPALPRTQCRCGQLRSGRSLPRRRLPAGPALPAAVPGPLPAFHGPLGRRYRLQGQHQPEGLGKASVCFRGALSQGFLSYGSTGSPRDGGSSRPSLRRAVRADQGSAAPRSPARSALARPPRPRRQRRAQGSAPGRSWQHREEKRRRRGGAAAGAESGAGGGQRSVDGGAAGCGVAAGRAQVQQDMSAETTEGTSISINCSHPDIKTNDFIYWYRQFPGRGPTLLVSSHKGSKELPDPPGRLSVAADRRSSSLWLAGPRRGDAAVYYCAVGDTARGAGAAAGHEPPWAGPGVCVGDGGTAPARPARGRCRPTRPAPQSRDGSSDRPVPAAASGPSGLAATVPREPATRNLLPPLTPRSYPQSHRDTDRNPPRHWRRRGRNRDGRGRRACMPGKERLQPPAPLAPGEEQRLSALHRDEGNRDLPAHGHPDSPGSCCRDRPPLAWNIHVLFSGFCLTPLEHLHISTSVDSPALGLGESPCP
ncbi:hypothetical protein QYF61_009867 [Mycteria americana]|uniref:Ig-like domain-containing protein n=1 Tax=Mycteria americana TaxID=33587 RepID=A0AAN7RIZ5_MYCAM|nr:hypothetical protein QYF61_009867 [Mycteria americana]